MTPTLAYLLPHPPKLSETFISDEIEALRHRGAEIEVYALVPGDGRGRALLSNAPSAIGAQLYWLACAPRRLLESWAIALSTHARSPKLFARAVLAVVAASRFAVQLQNHRAQHVHAHFATHSALAAWVIERLTGIPYSFTAHADDIFVRRPMLAQKVARASFVVAISEYNQRLLAQQLGETAASRIRVVRCGVPASRFEPLPPPISNAPFTILCVGRLEPKKGQRHLIEACQLLTSRGIAIRCWIVGEGRERARLERARDAAGLASCVALLGSRSRAQIRELLADAHVFALPSVVARDGRSDGIPVALMEAMAMQRPVVSTRISGIPELIDDGNSGRLVDPGDARALADALEQLYRDPASAARMACQAAQRVRERFDLDANVAQLERLFATCARAQGLERVANPVQSVAGLGEAGR